MIQQLTANFKTSKQNTTNATQGSFNHRMVISSLRQLEGSLMAKRLFAHQVETADGKKKKLFYQRLLYTLDDGKYTPKSRRKIIQITTGAMVKLECCLTKFGVLTLTRNRSCKRVK